MKLRHWQSECLERVITSFRKDNKHFLCLATPGAGKTVMASEVAARLLTDDEIDFVLCFSPSISVAEGFKATFSRRFNNRFDGVIGAVGNSYTYQAMMYFSESFWQLLNQYRVLVIFDEIHHCSGLDIESANSWGEEIILNIQTQATYTLALTGTPWRSDNSPIVLSKYSSKEKSIQCNYEYGLKQAVEDKVCRKPNIVLIDNEKIAVTDRNYDTQTFSSLKALFEEKLISYQELISDRKAIEFILKKGCQKLEEIRETNLNAGGLVVASSVAHANKIAHILQKKFAQSVAVVSYQDVEPSRIISRFRENTIQWIVAIGMVSEGTDIPRLQVCCHLSRIKTELYFRQVLGRVLRVNSSIDQNAWLYTFSEPKLVEFAYRIEQNLPETSVVFKEKYTRGEPQMGEDMTSNHFAQLESPVLLDFNVDDLSNDSGNRTPALNQYEREDFPLNSFEFIGSFREKLVSTFDSPF
jgi:superfamily II DNA or RNA helicase